MRLLLPLLLLLLPLPAAAQGPHLTWSGAGLAPTAFSLEAPGLPDEASLRNGAEGDDELSIEERRKIQEALRVRRKMVDVHQVLAFSAAGLIVASEIVGIINSRGLEDGEIRRKELEPSLGLHRAFAAGAMGAYWSAGVVAWAMPDAYKLNQKGAPKSKKVDSGELHAALSVIHGIAMGTLLVTGILQANVIPAGDAWAAVETTHAISGFTASGAVIAAAIVIGTL